MTKRDERNALISEIRAAFNEVSRGLGVSLHEAHAIDNYKSDVERRNARNLDTDKSWEDVPDKDIEYFFDVFSFLDVEGFRYYLPAYMVWAIKYFDVSDSCSRDNVIYSLSPYSTLAERNHQVFSSFNSAQCRAICRFLRFMQSNSSYADAEAASAALEAYWARYCSEN